MLYPEHNKIIGIVGGMGPHAGLALFNSILLQTKAKCDQEHLSTILMSFPRQIIDRTSFLECESIINPAFSIVKIIKRLEDAGAEVIGIACNTSHVPKIYEVIEEQLERINSHVKLLNMLEETCRYIIDNYPQAHRIGMLTTNGTYKSGVYRCLLEKLEFEVIVPDPRFQNLIIHRMIYDREFGLKSNAHPISDKVRLLWEKALLFFEEQGADTIILGCTELSLIGYEKFYNNMLIVDSTHSLARALIREATAPSGSSASA